MEWEKRVYLTKVVKITNPVLGEVQVPYLAGLSLDPVSPSDPYHWDVVYDSEGDPEGATPGIHHTCMVGVYTTLDKHAQLEADNDIIRIDNI